MESNILRDGKILIPAEIRKRHNIKNGDHLVWIDDGQTIRVIPVPADAITALYGCGKGQGLTQNFWKNAPEIVIKKME